MTDLTDAEAEAMLETIAGNLAARGELPADPLAAYRAIRTVALLAARSGRARLLARRGQQLGELSGFLDKIGKIFAPIVDLKDKLKEELRRIDKQVWGVINDAGSSIARVTLPSKLADLVDKGLALREKLHEESHRVADVVGPIVASYYTGGVYAAAAGVVAAGAGQYAKSQQKEMAEQLAAEESAALAELARAQQQLAQLRSQLGLAPL